MIEATAITLLPDAGIEAAAGRPRGLEANSSAVASRLLRVRGSHRFHFPSSVPHSVEAEDSPVVWRGAACDAPAPDLGKVVHEMGGKPPLPHRGRMGSGSPLRLKRHPAFVFAFRRRGVTMETAQGRFAEEVEAYPTGLVRGSWDEVGELLEETAKALSNLESLTGGLVFTPLRAPIEVGWRTPPDARDRFSGFLQSALEVYLTPLGVTVSGSRLRAAASSSARPYRKPMAGSSAASGSLRRSVLLG